MIGAALTTVGIFTSPTEHGFIAQLAIWLWFTVLFANFAEAVAEGRGKAQAASLRKARKETMARRLRNGREEKVPAPDLQKGDTVVCEAGDVIPADGDVIEGIASVDEAPSRANPRRSSARAAATAAPSPAARASSAIASSFASPWKRGTASWTA
jgi:K+-transporting ATPase ATPase B chain